MVLKYWSLGRSNPSFHHSNTPALQFFSYRRRDLWPNDQIFTPALEIGIVVVDKDTVTLAAGVEWNKRNIGQRVVADEVFAAGHFFVQCLKVLFHLFFSFVRFSVVRDIGSRWMNSAVHEVDPDARFGAQQGIARHQTNVREFFFQVLIDDGRLINDTRIIDQHRHFAVRISREQILGLFLKIDLNQIVRQLLFR